MIERVAPAEYQDDIRTKEDEEFNPGKKLHETLRDWCGEPTFEFGDLSNVDRAVGNSLLKYANELSRNGLFHLPFSRIAISFSIAEVVGVTILAEEKDTGEILMSVFTAIKNGPFTSHCWSRLRHDDEGILLQPFGCSVGRPVFVEERNVIARQTQQIMPMWAVGMLTLLEARGVEQRITPAPVALNKRRAAQGKPLIGEVREVVINIDGKAYRPSGDADRGSHAGPRLHWRRGHVRLLPSGELTHVRPHLVGARLGDELPAHKAYRVLT